MSSALQVGKGTAFVTGKKKTILFGTQKRQVNKNK